MNSFFADRANGRPGLRVRGVPQPAGEIFVGRGAGPILLDGIKETWERRFEDEESWVNELISNTATVHIMLLSIRGGSGVTDYAINLSENTGGLYEVFSAGTRLATVLCGSAVLSILRL